ncbi:hypothetical protein J6590_007277 [Homalodisca vitripennis]|nr:hypothetical protein J6590_007277 [Homalodisca vitripennis]
MYVVDFKDCCRLTKKPRATMKLFIRPGGPRLVLVGRLTNENRLPLEASTATIALSLCILPSLSLSLICIHHLTHYHSTLRLRLFPITVLFTPSPWSLAPFNLTVLTQVIRSFFTYSTTSVRPHKCLFSKAFIKLIL